jgi:CubicO group peptidase (beta-lactamase class C family)
LDYALLGKVIEAASGQTFEAFLQKTIFEPLQMSSTGYDHRQADLALGYASTGNSTVDLSDPEALFSMGALYSSAEDLYRWDQALYTEKLMPQKALDAMFTAAAVPMPSDWPSGWAPSYSWVIGPGKPLCLEQDNGLPGYKSVIYRYPEDKSVIIILTNQDSVNPWTDAADLVAKKLFGLACGEIASPKPTVAVAPPQTPAADIKALSADADALFQDIVKAGTFSGSALIAQNGQIILSQGYGFADRAKKTPNTPQTKFRLGSLTKQFTAMAIMILQEQGKLNVQDKVCAYLTDCPESWKPITLHQLLTHSSGIHDTSDPNTTLEKMFAYAKLIPLDFQPGTSWNYCNIGFALLGKVIEAASGQTYEAFLQKDIFEPLHMSNSGYDHGQPDLALGYADKGDSAVTPWDGQALFSFGALYSTAEDLYRWDQALYTEKLVSQKSLDAIFTAQVHIPAYPDWGYGYGWFIGPPALHFINHQGVVPGFGSVIYRYPDDKTTIIMLTNQQAVDEQAVNDLIGRADLVAKKLFGKEGNGAGG